MSVDLPIPDDASVDDDLFGENDGSEGNEQQASPDQDGGLEEVESPDEDEDDDDDDDDEDGEGDDDEDDEDGEGEDDDEDDEDEDGDDNDQEDADGDVDMDADGEQEDNGSQPKDPDMATPAARSPPPMRSPLAPIPANIIRRQRFVPAFDVQHPPKSLSLDPFISIAHPTGTHALAATPCMSYLLTGSQDGYIRCYDFFASANGKSLMTAQARGVANLGDGVTKGGVARGYWKNEVDVEEPEEADKPKPKAVTNAPAWLQVEAAAEEPAVPKKMVIRRKLEPVYSLVVQSDALWALSGSKTGVINLSTVRHAPGTIAHVLKGHAGPVSSLVLFNEDHSLISGSWDKTIKQWDLNTGQIVREFSQHAAHISTIQLRSDARPSPAQGFDGDAESGIKIHFSPKQEEAGDGAEDVDMKDVAGSAQRDKHAEMSAKDDDAKSDASFGSLFGDEENDGKSGGAADAQRRFSASLAGQIDPQKANSVEDGPSLPAAPKQDEAIAEPDIKAKPAKSHKRRPSMATKTSKRDQAALYSDDEEVLDDGPAPRFAAGDAPLPKVMQARDGLPTLTPARYKAYSDDVMLVASMDGQVALHDRRVGSSLVGELETTDKTPPWCMSACWSSDGRQVIAGRRQNTVDVWDVRRMGRSGAASTPTLLRTLKNPAGSGPVSCVAAFPDGQHIACASHDTLRLWNTAELWTSSDSVKKKSGVPFRIVSGHRSGTVSAMLIDPTSKYLVTASGDRGWTGETTQTVLVHEIKV